MALQLDGSCSCGAHRFRCVSETPYPYMRCYCSICRKTAGGGGYGINIMARSEGLVRLAGGEPGRYRARVQDPESGEEKPSPARRHFCRRCGSFLWVSDPRWPEAIYPFASAIDTSLPRPPEIVHIMLDYAADWVEVPRGRGHKHFSGYPEESIRDWHRRHGLLT